MCDIACVIDIGSTAIRLVVIEVSPDGQYRQLDRASRPVSLGRDVFMTQKIKPESMVQVVHILRNFAELLKNWDVSPEQAHIVATSAVREARNREIFVDRIRSKTNFPVQILDGVEENHLTYIAVQHAVKNFHASLSRANSIIMEVGGGSTELMIMHRGKMRTALNLKVGALRLVQQFRNQSRPMFTLEEFLLEQLRPSIAALQTDTNLQSMRYFIIVGGDMRLAARKIGEVRDEHYSVIKRDVFFDWLRSIQEMDAEEIVSHLNISYNNAEGLIPALLIFKLFLKETSVSEIIVPDVSIREGILLRNVLGHSSILDKDFTDQVVASARSLATRYHIDEEHAFRVKEMSLNLYDQISSEHGLTARDRLYLEVGAMLHSVGYFINQSGYHKHGQYIVANSEIFGLTQEEIQIVANLVRYHRGNKPVDNHPQFVALSGRQRLIVMKLSAILRVADSMTQDLYIKSPRIELEDSTLYISEKQGVLGTSNKLLFRTSFFEDVFGYKIVFR